jgi:flagellin-like hook-associated protein FlgL
MALIINHNMPAMNAARNLGMIYDRLSVSTQRLSSGLRINSAADDAAGLAIREQMRADIAVLNQGLRNAADGISMIQTAEGALSVIDEKLTRMKELAEQASTGTYTTAQRDIMNSEYQAMAAEIDRIANATDFNGIKLLDGSISNLHGGDGLKIHFGTGNDSDEDYYFINLRDARATVSTGLKGGRRRQERHLGHGGYRPGDRRRRMLRRRYYVSDRGGRLGFGRGVCVRIQLGSVLDRRNRHAVEPVGRRYVSNGQWRQPAGSGGCG